MQKAYSKQNKTWQRLKKNRLAFAGLIIIFLSVLISIFGYFIAPDSSPNADLQTVEIQAKKPGYEQLFLRIPLPGRPAASKLQQLFNGRPDDFTYVPITGWSKLGDSISVSKYIDEDTSVVQTYSVRQLMGNDEGNPDKLVTRKKYLLGTDSFGRDILSRLIIGTRVSLLVGLIAVIISLSLGIILGAAAGYFRGRVDEIIMWFVNVAWSIPTLLLVFAITMALGKGFWQVFIAVGLTLWVNVARLVRGQVIGLKNMEYIQAAKALGFSDTRIIVKHILPNIIGPLMVLSAGNFATAIIIEAGLSFLGIGVQPPQPSLGLMIKENYNFIITHNPLLALIPGFAIMILVLAFNLLGNGLRDAVDVRE